MLDFEKMTRKKGKFANKIVFGLKNNRRTSAHFQNPFFWTLWLFLFSTNLKWDRPNEPKSVKNPEMSQVVKERKFQNSQRVMNFFS